MKQDTHSPIRSSVPPHTRAIARTARPLFFLAAPLAVVLLFCGCAYRTPRPTGYLNQYDNLERQPLEYRGIHATKAPADPPAVTHVLQVLPALYEAAPLDPKIEEELRAVLDARLNIYLKRYLAPSILVTTRRDVSEYLQAGATVTQLRVAITDLTPGIGITRMLLPGIGPGGTHLQIEGSLTDVGTGRVLAAFARRGVNHGTALIFPTPQSLSRRFSWKFNIVDTTKPIARWIAARLQAPPPQWWAPLGLQHRIRQPRRDARPVEVFG
jgi:hypothetical protein